MPDPQQTLEQAHIAAYHTACHQTYLLFAYVTDPTAPPEFKKELALKLEHLAKIAKQHAEAD